MNGVVDLDHLDTSIQSPVTGSDVEWRHFYTIYSQLLFPFFSYSRPRFENFDMPRSSYEQMDGGGGGPAGLGGDGGDESPMSLDDYERPPLRHIDKYLKAELPCIKTTRYTMALMTCIGFIISFGMRCNLSFAKLSSKPVVS